MPTPISYDYAIVRVVPRVERGEFVNAGVILSSTDRTLLVAAIEFDPARVTALDPQADLAALRAALDAIPRICAGGADAGPLGRLSRRERFHWLVAPRSTTIQTSPVHTGVCTTPETLLQRLLQRMVRVPAPEAGRG